MEITTKIALSEALKKAMKEEHLWSNQTAQLLNTNPLYVTLMLNPKYFKKIGSTAWGRLEEWFKTGDTLSNFKFPSDEVVWKPKEKAESKDYNIQSPKKVKIPKNKIPKPPLAESEKDKTAISGEPVEAVEKNLLAQETTKESSSSSHSVPEEFLKEIQEEIVRVDYVIEKKNKALGATISEQPSNTINQKISLDIEINLLINGQKIKVF
jgi:hypothetical protein